MSGEVLLTLYNNHVESCGAPPQLTNQAPQGKSKYFGYFENEHGEQWVFVYDLDTEKGTLQGGDAGWEHTYHLADDGHLVNGDGDSVVLSKAESAWLAACYATATEFKEAREARRKESREG